MTTLGMMPEWICLFPGISPDPTNPLAMSDFLKQLQLGRPLLLDGATGTELAARGYPLTGPGWSATAILKAPELLVEIHRDYVRAGARIITANTFRTQRRSLTVAGWGERAAELTSRAVELTRQAAATDTLIAGSMSPLADCYSPQLTPGEQELCDEHAEHAQHLAQAGVDLLLVETQITALEAELAVQAAVTTGLPVWVSFTLGRPLPDDIPRLLSGEPLSGAVKRVLDAGALGISLNCIPAVEVLPAIEAIRELYSSRGGQSPWWGAYANTGRLLSHGQWEDTEAVNPAVYAGYVHTWLVAGCRLLGGCCGTGPQHIELIRKELYGE